MSIARTFCGWNRPLVELAVAYLVDRFAGEALLDLDRVVLVVPGSRAGRRVMELLAEAAEQKSLILFPPHVQTIGSLPELLYESKRPFASELTQQLAWAEALKSLNPESVRQFISQRPADNDPLGWLDLGRLLWRQHRELAADGHDFSDVVEIGKQLDDFEEYARWRFLRTVQEKYLASLDALELWDVQSARLHAIEHQECRTDKQIILLGTVDMNRTTRLMLRQVRDHVTAIVGAPEDQEQRFDDFGCLIPEAWASARVPLATAQVRVCDGPADQAYAVVDEIAGYNGQYRADEIRVGVPDERLVPQIERQLLQYGIRSRPAVGKLVAETKPYQFLDVAGRFISARRYHAFASLVRHPDVHAWSLRLGLPSDWLTELDEYYNEHLQPVVGTWLGQSRRSSDLEKLDAALSALFGPLIGPARPLCEWADPIAAMLLEFYGEQEANREELADHYTLNAAKRIRDALVKLRELPRKLAPHATASAAIKLVCEQLQRVSIAPPAEMGAVELLGWLELPLDDTPALVLTSFNEGFLPTSLNSDLFLPNSLRQRLGLVDNARRFARDAYALNVLAASRRELTVIIGRRDTEGNTLVPSRLAFAVAEDQIPQRVVKLFGTPESTADFPSVLGGGKVPERSAFVLKKPPPLPQPLQSLSVTAFRDYLICPYRFYLRHVLGLEALDDEAEELSAQAFGNFMHDVLKAFGLSPVKDSADADEIWEFLDAQATAEAESRLGKLHLPATDVQLRQIQQRLRAFADWQADWRRQGWQIRHAEVSPGSKQPVHLHVSADLHLQLRGRIDRIDQHEGSGEWSVFDYKTGDGAKKPNELHRSSGKWVDLQLPLYRHLVGALDIHEPLRLGYISLPKDTRQVGAYFADWTADDLEHADQTALEVAEAVMTGVFWPPVMPAPRNRPEFGPICQDGVYAPQFEAAEASP